MSRLILLASAALLGTAAVGAGGWYLVNRNTDPYQRAEALANKGDLRAAQVELRNALRTQPSSARAHLQLAKVEAKLADPVSAEKEFRLAAGLGADPWEIIPQLGEAMVVQGKYKEVLSQVPARGPTPEIAAKDLLLRAVAQLSLNDLPAAQATLAEAQKMAPNQVETPLIAARVAAAMGDLAGTETNIEKVLKRDPNQVEALLMQEQLLTSKGDHDEALAIASRAVASAPWSAMARIDRAYQLMFKGQDDKAQDDVNAVLAAQPLFIDAIYLNGILLARHGKFADASVELGRLEGMGSRFPQALYYQAKVSLELGQNESAADEARRYNALVPKDAEGVKLVARTALASNQAAQALPILEKAVGAGQHDAETLDLLGRLYVAAGVRGGAVKAFTQAQEESPNDAGILTNLGLAKLRQGETESAITALQKAVELDPKLALAWEGLVQADLTSGDLPGADKALQQLRSLSGETETVGILTGQLKLRQFDVEGAQAAWTATLRAFPNSVSARFNLAKLLIEQGDRTRATTLLAEAVAKEPASLTLLQVYLPLLLRENQVPTAIQTLEAARKADPNQPVFTSMLADTYTTVGDAKRALSMLQDLQRTSAFPPVLLPALARAQVASGLNEDAKATYQKALSARPTDFLTRLGLVDLLQRTQAMDAAEATLRDGVKASPGDITAMEDVVQFVRATKGRDAALKAAAELRADPANLPYAEALKGDLLMRDQQFADAAQAYLAEYKADPSLPILLRMSAAFASSGHDDDAAGYLRAWLKDHPDTPDAAGTLAKLDITAKRWGDAKTHLEMVLAKRPNDPQALNNLAWTYFSAGDPRAREAAQQAYLRAPSPDTADTLGWIMVNQGAAKAAIPLLQRASQQRPGNPTIRYHLAAALNSEGQKDEAATMLKAIVDGKQVFAERGDASKLLESLSRKN